jgi:ADP-ribose pyrophosphatase YjhB (NUDIX family)
MGEQPEDAVRREVREETGLEHESAEIAFIRTHGRPARVEIIYRCRADGDVQLKGYEIKSADWCAPDDLPSELNQDQRWIIKTAMNDG